ncbi:MAG: hypothetical protein A2186_02510 [Candidatus Levybacteria bacterium RIFOXYA1_FULL_41_10]|nr:MAG: hypothetical protein UT46_C0004G0021 [Candidatus Levybacteria bacterium GW2011_GWA1_39_34]KKR51276.1 MAG: hypothetical protein UT87_C0007G0036 [Candidatus Levybacteria bacterium GW2011_GWC1_40_19]KKR94637.1 MAG: hypothetical protein UU45_C0008G0037 [Candidatus Levybacteria bacterium GW2011_GWA2_41_15]KKS02043.1 MAG: hypothetical protein UU52_C0004G0021 [Candidatus Levybacteria bacterium GW2011_GWB1_41_21]OGH20526.1 MAG: hypothetical protein A2695_01230 [Candidatus Levybacteria bacterium
MDKSGVFGEILETGQQAASSAGKGLKKAASDFANSATGQITGDGSGTNEDLSGAQKGMSDDQAQQFLRDLYGKSKKDELPVPQKEAGQSQSSNEPQDAVIDQNPVQKALGITPFDPNAQKSPEELVRIEALRRKLHGEYYENLTNPPKPQEERPVEKVEREEKEDRWKLQDKKAKEPPPLAVQNAQKVEKNPGASG